MLQVRSLTLDDWDPELLDMMLSVGNARLNSFYEAALPPGVYTATRCDPAFTLAPTPDQHL
jgi:putative GTPase activating protein for Arf